MKNDRKKGQPNRTNLANQDPQQQPNYKFGSSGVQVQFGGTFIKLGVHHAKFNSVRWDERSVDNCHFFWNRENEKDKNFFHANEKTVDLGPAGILTELNLNFA